MPKGYSKASCHDFRAARSKASEVMAPEARGRQRYGGLEIVGKYVETNLLAKTLSVFRSYLKSSLHKKKDGAWTGSNRRMIKIKVQFGDDTILPDEPNSIYQTAFMYTSWTLGSSSSRFITFSTSSASLSSTDIVVSGLGT